MSEAINLLATQREFLAAVRSSAAQQTALRALVGDAARNQDLLAVYRGNAVANAHKALSLAYPVIEKIVGAEFFAGLCRAFWVEQPSRSGDLNEYGEGFDAFLAHFSHVAEMPYLADVARLEWYVSRAMTATDPTALALSELVAVPSEAMGGLRFGLQVSLVLLESAWPIASIWQQHQADYGGEINIDLDIAENLAVFRQGFTVMVVSMGIGEMAFWRSAQAGSSLAETLEAAFTVDENFDIQGALQAGFAREFVTDIHNLIHDL